MRLFAKMTKKSMNTPDPIGTSLPDVTAYTARPFPNPFLIKIITKSIEIAIKRSKPTRI